MSQDWDVWLSSQRCITPFSPSITYLHLSLIIPVISMPPSLFSFPSHPPSVSHYLLPFLTLVLSNLHFPSFSQNFPCPWYFFSLYFRTSNFCSSFISFTNLSPPLFLSPLNCCHSAHHSSPVCFSLHSFFFFYSPPLLLCPSLPVYPSFLITNFSPFNSLSMTLQFATPCCLSPLLSWCPWPSCQLTFLPCFLESFDHSAFAKHSKPDLFLHKQEFESTNMSSLSANDYMCLSVYLCI